MPCSAVDAVQREADVCVSLLEEALTDAVDAYTCVDGHRSEMLRARVNNARRDAELRLNALNAYAVGQGGLGPLCSRSVLT